MIEGKDDFVLLANPRQFDLRPFQKFGNVLFFLIDGNNNGDDRGALAHLRTIKRLQALEGETLIQHLTKLRSHRMPTRECEPGTSNYQCRFDRLVKLHDCQPVGQARRMRRTRWG